MNFILETLNLEYEKTKNKNIHLEDDLFKIKTEKMVLKNYLKNIEKYGIKLL